MNRHIVRDTLYTDQIFQTRRTPRLCVKIRKNHIRSIPSRHRVSWVYRTKSRRRCQGEYARSARLHPLRQYADHLSICRSDRSGQITSVLNILHRTLQSSSPPPSDLLVTFATHLINSENTPLIVGRSALTALVLALGAGLTIDLRLLKPSLYSTGQPAEKLAPEDALDADERRFYEIGKEAWVGKDEAAFEARKKVVVGIIDAAGSLRNDAGSDGGRGWCDEQVNREVIWCQS